MIAFHANLTALNKQTFIAELLFKLVVQLSNLQTRYIFITFSFKNKLFYSMTELLNFEIHLSSSEYFTTGKEQNQLV